MLLKNKNNFYLKIVYQSKSNSEKTSQFKLFLPSRAVSSITTFKPVIALSCEVKRSHTHFAVPPVARRSSIITKLL